MINAAPRFLDGLTSRPQTVTFALTEQSLILYHNGQSIAVWVLANIRVKEDWDDSIGAILGYKDSPDAGLIIQNKKEFESIQRRLPRRHQTTFIVPSHYRSILVMAIGAVACGFLLFPLLGQLAGLATILVPQSAEKKFGQVLIEDMATEYTPCDDKIASLNLQKIADRLGAATGQKDLKADIHIFKSSEANAFSLPGQKIAVLSGFLNDATSENEIAAVMAHEMGHMAKRDALEAFIESQGLGIVTGLMGSSGSYGGVAQITSFMHLMNYSRKKEFAADEYGAKLLLKAGYSPQGLSSFLERVDKEEANDLGASKEYLEILSTHPDTKERVKRIHQISNKSEFKTSLTPDEFTQLKNACRSIGNSKALK